MSITDWFKYKFYKIISSILTYGEARDRLHLLHTAAIIDDSTKVSPEAKIDNFAHDRSLISIGGDSIIRGQILIFAHAGKIQIGKDCYVGEGSRIWSSSSIVIGDRVLVSHDVNIHDTDSHSLNMEIRHQHFIEMNKNGHPKSASFDIQAKPVVIHDDVWIGFNSSILKGVTIGKGAVIAACSVVTKDVPEGTIVAGNPARVLKKT